MFQAIADTKMQCSLKAAHVKQQKAFLENEENMNKEAESELKLKEKQCVELADELKKSELALEASTAEVKLKHSIKIYQFS